MDLPSTIHYEPSTNMENFIVSARKYRPQNFSTVVGQQHITTTLKNAINNNQLAHAFLFCGPRGVGKTTCARILAKTINCENKTKDGEACNTCNSCVSFDAGTSLNIHELDAASNNSVDDIRTLVEQVRFAPQAGKYKVYIVDEVHMLSSSAFNAFLKTLEEPPPFAIFILATTEKHKIIPTILSRCQIFDFKRITNNDTLEHLNILDEDYYFKLLDFMQQQQLGDAMLLHDEINRKGFEGDTVLEGFAEFIRNLLVSKDAKAAILLEVADDFKQRYLQAAQQINTGWLIGALNILNEATINYKQARNKRLHVELTIIKLSYLHQAIELVNNEGVIGKKKLSDSKAIAFRALPLIKLKDPEIEKKEIPVSKKLSEAKLIVEEEEPKIPVQRTATETGISTKGGISSLQKIRQQVSQQNKNNGTQSKPLTEDELYIAWGAYI